MSGSAPRVIFGVSSMPRAGKGEAWKIIQQVLEERGISYVYVRFSTLLRETLELWNWCFSMHSRTPRENLPFPNLFGLQDPGLHPDATSLTISLWGLPNEPSNLRKIGKIIDQMTDNRKITQLSIDRETLQELPRLMVKNFFNGVVAYAIKSRIERLDARFIYVDGVRWWEDVELIRLFPNNHLCWFHASQVRRHRRANLACENEGDETKTIEQFMREDEREFNQYALRDIEETADFVINNDTDDKELLKREVLRVFEENIFPLLT